MDTADNHGNATNKEPAASQCQAAPKKATQCKCKATDHLRISYAKCPLNPKNIAKVIAEAAAAALVAATSATNVVAVINDDSAANKHGAMENS